MRHQAANALRRLRPDHLVDHRRLGFHRKVAGHTALHDMRAQQLTAVGDGRHRADHLNRRNRDALAETVCPQVGHRPAWVVETPVLPRHLAAQVDIRVRAEPETIYILVERFGADALGDLNCDHIVGMGQRIRDRQRTHRLAIAVLDRMFTHEDRAGVNENRALLHRVDIERGRERDQLENGTRFVLGADRRIGKCVGIPFFETVAIECGPVGHAQNRARVRVHYDDRAPLGPVETDPQPQLLFDNVLDGAVDGHHQALAVAPGQKPQNAVVKLRARNLLPPRETNAVAGKEVPVVALDTQYRHPFGIEKTQNLAGQRSLRIEASRVGRDMNVVQQKILVSQSPLPFCQEQLALFKIDLRRNDQVVSATVFRQQSFNLQRRHTDPLRQPLRDCGVVLRCDKFGRCRDAVGESVRGKQVAVPVDDHAPRGCIVHRIARRRHRPGRFILLPAHHLHIQQPQNQQDQRPGQYDADKADTPYLRRIGPRGGRLRALLVARGARRGKADPVSAYWLCGSVLRAHAGSHKDCGGQWRRLCPGHWPQFNDRVRGSVLFQLAQNEITDLVQKWLAPLAHTLPTRLPVIADLPLPSGRKLFKLLNR